jgi:hypothetical protein
LENPKLTPAMRKEHLAWAHKYKSWTGERYDISIENTQKHKYKYEVSC